MIIVQVFVEGSDKVSILPMIVPKIVTWRIIISASLVVSWWVAVAAAAASAVIVSGWIIRTIKRCHLGLRQRTNDSETAQDGVTVDRDKKDSVLRINYEFDLITAARGARCGPAKPAGH